MSAKRQSTPVLRDFRVINIVSSTKAKRNIDIEKLMTHLNRTQYEPGIFPGLIYRRENPKATITIFSTGKIVSTGAKSEEDSRKSIFVTLSEIANIEEKQIEIGQIKMENIVAISSTGFEIDLEKLYESELTIEYDPSIFPAAICKVGDKSKVLIFENGKMILAGSKSSDNAKEMMETIFNKLLEFKIVPTAPTA